MVEEELDGLDINDIANLVDLPRLMFIDEILTERVQNFYENIC